MAEKESQSDEVTTEDVEEHATTVSVVCDPCLQDGENNNADGFCVDCNEYLCSVCYTAHRKIRTTRSHVLNDKTSMPVSKPVKINELEICAEQHATAVSVFCDLCLQDGENNNADGFCVDCNEYLCSVCYTAHRKLRATRSHVLNGKTSMPVSKHVQINELEICAEHKFQLVTHYCQSHDKALCKLCKQIDHRKCTEIQSIDDICCGSEELKQIKDQLESLQNELKENTETAKENKANAEKYHLDVIQSVRRFRDKDLEMISSIENTCETLGPQISCLMNDIDNFSTSNERLAALLTLKIKTLKNILNARLTSVKMDNTISRYRFVATNTSDELSSGVLGVIRKCPFKFRDIDVKSGKFACEITGMIRLSDSRLVLLDYNNYKIQLVDMISNTIVSDIRMGVTLYGLTRINEKTIAVTSFYTKAILIVSVSDTFTVQKTIQTSSLCRGIAYFNNSLVVSYGNKGQILILDMNGSVKQDIHSEEKNGKELFTGDISIAINPNTNILYISDHGNNKVLSMTLDGKVTACFTHEHMKSPRDLTVNRDGRVFVCSLGTSTIFEISSDLSKGQVILNEKDGISTPRCIIYNDKEGSICVGSSQKNTIQTFLL